MARPIELLDPAVAERLSREPFTYAEVGATTGPLPAGYHHVVESLVLGTGREVFDAAAQTLLTWRMHADAGLTVRASAPRVVPDAVVVMRVGVGPFAATASCRVVDVVDEPDRRGFVYGTLARHPESGEESFVVAIDADGRVTATITAFSRPASLVARIGGPVGRRVQTTITRRYLAALT